ncbi:MAG: PorT family protein [Chitinophagaceae bacterium]|nr:MAG: PorT family protein [Chitinophagaceae bacterium]
MKTIYQLLFLFIISSATIAQPHFGIKGGLNMSNLFVDEVDDENVRIGYHAGIFIEAPVTDRISIQPELVYNTKGATVKYDNLISGEFTFALDYIDLPLLAVINLSDNFNIKGGMYASYLLRAKAINESDGIFDFTEEINRDNFNDFDYGISAGLGFKLNWLHAGLRYNYGLREIGRERETFGITYRPTNARNSVA